MASTVEKTNMEATPSPVTASSSRVAQPVTVEDAQPSEAFNEKPEPTVAVQASPSTAAPPATDAASPHPRTATAQATFSGASPAEQPVAAVESTVQDSEQRASFRQRLKDADRYWAWKVAFRALQCIFCLTGIACCAWIITSAIGLGGDGYYGRDYRFDRTMTTMAIPIFVLSILWGMTDLLVRLCRKPPRPTHPAVSLSIDLCFWLALIIPIIASVVAWEEIRDFGLQSGPYGTNALKISGFTYGNGYRGEYYLNQTTDTWIYNVTWVESGDREYNYTSRTWYYPEKDPSTVVRDCSGYYRSCAEQDALINAMWKQKPTRNAVILVVVVALCAVAFCHFQLFVHACVDTHKLRMRKKETILAKTIEGMLATGQLVLSPAANGQLVMRPSPVHLPVQFYNPAMQQAPPTASVPAQGVRYA